MNIKSPPTYFPGFGCHFSFYENLLTVNQIPTSHLYLCITPALKEMLIRIRKFKYQLEENLVFKLINFQNDNEVCLMRNKMLFHVVVFSFVDYKLSCSTVQTGLELNSSPHSTAWVQTYCTTLGLTEVFVFKI